MAAGVAEPGRAAADGSQVAGAPHPSGWRGSREAWLAAATETLVQSGVEAVRILPLSARLGISRTSFYWFFEDRQDLLTGLIGLWRDGNTGNFVARAGLYSESVVEGLLNVFDCWLTPALFDSGFEFAVRSWALHAPEVAAEVASADAARIAALGAMFIRYGYPPLEADVRARATYLTQIGYISMKTREDLDLRMRRIPDYVALFTGQDPKPNELERFYARHGYRAPAARAAGQPAHPGSDRAVGAAK